MDRLRTDQEVLDVINAGFNDVFQRPMRMESMCVEWARPSAHDPTVLVHSIPLFLVLF